VPALGLFNCDQADMAYDLENYGGALVAAVNTQGLPNWGGLVVNHFVSVNGYNPSALSINYVDTADQTNGTGGGTFINTSMGEHQFWQNAIHNANNPTQLVIY
jgi:hypothetical protein